MKQFQNFSSVIDVRLIFFLFLFDSKDYPKYPISKRTQDLQCKEVSRSHVHLTTLSMPPSSPEDRYLLFFPDSSLFSYH